MFNKYITYNIIVALARIDTRQSNDGVSALAYGILQTLTKNSSSMMLMFFNNLRWSLQMFRLSKYPLKNMAQILTR